MAFSFPYPKVLKKPRKPGQGCKSCVHKTYCPALYWMRRGPSGTAMEQNPIDDNQIGIACASWSDNPSEKVHVSAATEDDLAYEERMFIDGIGAEANPNGLTEPTTGTYRRP